MRVSELYNLGRNQSSLDFLDINLATDIPVFLDASAIRSLQIPWGHELRAILDDFFGLVLRCIREGRDDDAQRLLASLSESNEYRLGLSAGRSQGYAFGTESAENVWSALTDEDGEVADLLTTIEDSILLVRGVGSDMVSDAICNILRGPFIRFTQDACVYYGIPLTSEVHSGPIWNLERHCWEETLVDLPVHDTFGKFILVPKNIVRHKVTCNSHSYYRHFLLPVMGRHEVASRTSIVQYRRNNQPFVTKKDLMEKYGADKLAVVQQTKRYPEALQAYKRTVGATPKPPLTHNEVSDCVHEERTNWQDFIDELEALPTGQEHASAYEDLIERIFSALFYPSLCFPSKQVDIHDRRKRIDITYANEAKSGFFYWIQAQFPSLFIIVECKNYSGEVANAEVDQLAGRFSPSRGQVGLLVYRSVSNRPRLEARCKDTAVDRRGWIVSLSDEDVIALIREKEREENVNTLDADEVQPSDFTKSKYTRLREKMTALVN